MCVCGGGRVWGDKRLSSQESKRLVVIIRGMAGKFVDTPAIRKSNASLKKRFA